MNRCQLPDSSSQIFGLRITWFGSPRAEAHFANHDVLTQAARFNFVVAALPPEAAMEVRDIIHKRPEEGPYDKLKAELVSRTSESDRSRFQRLLSAEDLGDRKPTQMLRKMHQLLRDKASTFDEAFLRKLFLQRLHGGVRMILVSTGGTFLESLAQMAASTI